MKNFYDGVMILRILGVSTSYYIYIITEKVVSSSYSLNEWATHFSFEALFLD